MTKQRIDRGAINALTSFSVGTLDGRDAMMVIEYAPSPEDLVAGVRKQLPIAMTPAQAKELAEGLLMAAASAGMGAPPSAASN
jgi:hypothetical protein